MNSHTKTVFTYLYKESSFSCLVKKVSLDETLTELEWSYVLAYSLVLLEQFNVLQEDGLFQFAYYLILKYSIATKDFRPLYDLSVDAGFFPISSYLINEKDINIGLDDLIINSSVRFDLTEKDMVFIGDQKHKMDLFLSDTHRFKSLIAPTSYGKSKFIDKDIIEHPYENKVGVIVPTKALIWQSFVNLKNIGKTLKRKIMIHDTEYDNRDSFIGIFTQERALRLLEDNDIYFDTLYIDEAHNLFEKDERSILLARLIKINEKKNPRQRVVFLSPLVEESKNLSFNSNVLVSESRINNSIKEYDIRYYDSNSGTSSVYNRFINDLIPTNISYKDAFDYIFKNAKNKNLIYFYSPKNIEKFANDFCKNVCCINDQHLIKLASLIESYSDKDYLMVEMIKRGAIYIHSKVPDFLKNYLYDCFNKTASIKYLVSNGCVLEGVDFSIDSLFILDTYSLDVNKTINLVGRVNRLKSIFNADGTKLSKLLCPIHYVFSPNYCNKNFINKIKLLRSDVKDEISNPLLYNATPPSDEKKKKEFNDIKAREDDYINNNTEDLIAKLLIKNGVEKRYENFDSSLKIIKEKLPFYEQITDLKALMYAISDIFIKDHNLKSKYLSLSRLNKGAAVDYYYNYLSYVYHSTLKAKIDYVRSNILYIKENGTANGAVYVGESFGRTTLKSNPNDHFKAYIEVRELAYKEIVNIAIIKTKVEDDFLDFEIAPYVKIMLDLKLIGEELYNKFMYGTSDSRLVMLYKLGLSSQFIRFILEYNLLSEIEDVGYGIRPTDKFKEELQKQDDIIQFEIKHFLVD